MKCEACGGDGQIEYGAYRGDESGPTRECKLCGGVITGDAPLSAFGASAASASAALTKLAHASSKAGLTLVSSNSGARVPEAILSTGYHQHQWSWRIRGQAVYFECVNDCGTKMLFSAYGSLIEGKPIEPVEMQYLSRRATMIYESHINSLKTARQVADERLEQLKRENERQQAEALVHVHTWQFVKVTNGRYGNDLSDRCIYFECECGQAGLRFNTGGQLVAGKVQPTQVELDQLSEQARVEGLRDKARRREQGML